MEKPISQILVNPDFVKDLTSAIAAGKSVDYYFNGEEEVSMDVYDVDCAKQKVMEVLIEYLIKK